MERLKKKQGKMNLACRSSVKCNNLVRNFSFVEGNNYQKYLSCVESSKQNYFSRHSLPYEPKQLRVTKISLQTWIEIFCYQGSSVSIGNLNSTAFDMVRPPKPWLAIIHQQICFVYDDDDIVITNVSTFFHSSNLLSSKIH